MPPTAACASLLLVEFGCLGAEAFQLGCLGPETFQLGSLIRGKRSGLASRLRLTAGISRLRLTAGISRLRLTAGISRLRLTAGIRHAHLAVTSAAPAAQRRFAAAVPVSLDLLGTASIQPV